ncbi:hypothetical protein N9L68_04940 [bacterium]|nr:hypothetical protein [bacterium]
MSVPKVESVTWKKKKKKKNMMNHNTNHKKNEKDTMTKRKKKLAHHPGCREAYTSPRCVGGCEVVTAVDLIIII